MTNQPATLDCIQGDKLVTMPVLTSIDVGDICNRFLRDESLTTVSDVLLWASSARINSGSSIGFNIWLNDANKWEHCLNDISTIEIDGLCNSFSVHFTRGRIWSATFKDTQYSCDSIVFHKGDFIAKKNGREIANISAVY